MPSPKQLLDHHGINPKKSLGQNYLHDGNTLRKIVDSAELPPDATVLEIGPGLGALSVPLAEKCKRLILIETDTRIQPILEAQLLPYPHVDIHWADVMVIDLAAIMGTDPYYVVANLPYYITSAIIRKLLEAPNRPLRMVLTVQKEVAERIVATPGNMSLLSVAVQFYGQPQTIMRLNPGVFWPRPDVSSAVVRIDCYQHLPLAIEDEAFFFSIVRAGFSQKRKQLKNALSGGLPYTAPQIIEVLETADIDIRRRAETLTLAEWGKLYESFTNISLDSPPQ